MMRNSKKIIAIFSFVIIVLICLVSSGYDFQYFFAEMIYGGENPINSDIIFSKESGFYEDDFYLKIYAPSEEVYYTLDGSEPTKDSFRYKSKILIEDASKNENVYSAREDVCGSFISAEPLHKVPDYPVDKCTIIRVAYYDAEGNRSSTETRTYFVDFEEKTGYDSVNVIAVTTDPANLFSSEKGIYVLGDTFEQYKKENDLSSRNYYRWGANFLNRGKEWEREADIEIFDENKGLQLSQTVGIRIQGGVSRGLLPKSLNFYARDEYGDNRMRYDFFDTGYYPKRVTLSGGGNDYYGKMLDRLGAELTENCEFCTMNYEPYVLFLNGEYWGYYHLTEKYDEHYIEQYYGVNSDNVVIVKGNKLEVGIEGDLIQYEDMKNFIEQADMTVDENYQLACSLLDIESFIDYFAAEIYMARQVDWPSANFALWRSRNVSEKPYEDGKWRWMLFDVNTAAFLESFKDHDTLAYVLEESAMFASMYRNREFRKAFSQRIQEMADTIFEPSLVEQKISLYEELMAEPMEKNHQRFFGIDNEMFFERAGRMKEFAVTRKPYVEMMLETNLIE